MRKCPACGAENEDKSKACVKCEGPLPAEGPAQPSFFARFAFWKRRADAGPVARPEVDRMFADQEAAFPKPPPAPYVQLGYFLIGFALFLGGVRGLAAILHLELHLDAVMPLAGILVVVGALLAFLRPELGKANYFVLIGKALVILYAVGAVLLASVSLASHAMPPADLVRVLALTFPILPLGAWAVVAGPDPRDVHPEAFFGRGIIAGYALLAGMSSALYYADQNLLRWEDLLQVYGIGAIFWFGGVIALFVDILRTPHPTRG